MPCPAIKKISVVVRLSITNPLIRKLGGFTDLSGTEVAALCNATGRAREFRARHDIIREGDKPGPVFVMLEGWAFRYKILADGNRQIMAFLMPGDCSNLNIGMLDEMDHSVQTACRARVAAIPRAEITALVADHPGIARALSLAQLTDEATLRAWIICMGRRSTLARVAHLLCELYLRARLTGLSDGHGLELPVSQIVLADSLGMTPVHFSRVLRKLRDAKVVTLTRGSLTILDLEGLIDIAGFDQNYLHRVVPGSDGS